MECKFVETEALPDELETLRRRVAELEAKLAQQSAPAPGDFAAPAQAPMAGKRLEAVMLRAILHELPDHLYFKDRQSRFLRISDSQVAKFGLSDPAEAVGKTDFDIFTLEHAQQAYDDEQRIIRTGEPLTGIVEKETWPDGHITWVSTTKMPLRDESGAVVGTYGLTRDITVMKRMEQALEAERTLLQKYAADLDEANKELRQFTYIVSHDLRAPLVNLKGFSTELRSALDVIRETTRDALAHLPPAPAEKLRCALEEDVPEALDFINSSVSRMDGFINALLHLSRLGHRELRPERLDMNDVVRATLKTLAHQIEQRKIAVTVDDLPQVSADKTALEQVWTNLLNNAVVYMKPGRAGQIHVTGAWRGEEAVFQVRDNGRGIRAGDMDKVFAPFRRAGKQDVPGEGMGLSYVLTLLRRHGGNIRCESEDDVGTQFTFTLKNLPEKEITHA